jgi:putative nucleotidyltransferase with HDIG domain
VIDLDAVCRSARDLEPLPVSVTRLVSLLADENAPIAAVAQVVGYDPALTGRILSLANTAARQGAAPIVTVQDAVVRLGTGAVLTLTVSSALRRRMTRAVPEYGLTEGDLWRHSVATAVAAELLPRFAGVRLPPETATAALLHDVGKLVMARYLRPPVVALLDQARASGLHRLAAEREVLLVHHGELAALMAQSWRLPESIARAVGGHHEPGTVDTPVAHAVHLADVVAKAIGAGLEEDNLDPVADTEAMAALRIRPDAFGTWCEHTALRFSEVVVRYS